MKFSWCWTLLAASVSATAAAQSAHATQVVAFDDKGQAGGGIFMPGNVLGAPDGAVNSLGLGGWITLGFQVVLVDGPGADLLVAENAFYSGPLAHAFAEVMFVEVSSDGSNFARVPSRYVGPAVNPGPFGVIDVGSYEGLVGMTPANLAAADPQDVVDAGGDAIDLADCANDPLVLSGAVNLRSIRYVRLVDVQAGIDRDSVGTAIFDPGAGSADPDALTVIHHQGNANPRGPTVDVTVPPDGRFSISMSDPDGWPDLDPSTLRLALWGIPVNFADLLPLLTVTRFDPLGFTVQLATPLPPGFLLRVSASVKDRAGNRSGDARSRV